MKQKNKQYERKMKDYKKIKKFSKKVSKNLTQIQSIPDENKQNKNKKRIMIPDFKRKEIFNMENEKVKYLIDMINEMDIKDKLRLAICMSQSKWSSLIYNTKENLEKFDSMLKDIDEEYRTTLINFGKYKLVMFVMAKLMEMETTEQNEVALYLFNNIKAI